MNANSLERFVSIVNPQGLHARPADLIVRCTANFQSVISIYKDSEQADCRSILSLLTLGATEGTQLKVTACGDDAAAALDAIGSLFEQGFYELDDVMQAPATTSGMSQGIDPYSTP